jgi:phosphatidate cytidylyltransferase
MPEPAPAPGGRSLPLAVVTAVVLLGVVAGGYALGRRAFLAIILVVVALAAYELLAAAGRAGRRVVAPIGVAGVVAMIAVAYARRPALFSLVLAATAFAALIAALRPTRGASPMTDAAWTLLAVVWIGGGGAGATAIMMLEPHGLSLLVVSVLIIALDDIGAYFAGVRFGRHKLAPSISPGKTWEGFVGGALTAVAGGLAFGTAFAWLGKLDGLVLGGLAASCAPAGDLIESLAKRELGVKDSSGLLPGHGGFLDRVDAIVLCAPVFYLYLRFLAS